MWCQGSNCKQGPYLLLLLPLGFCIVLSRKSWRKPNDWWGWEWRQLGRRADSGQIIVLALCSGVTLSIAWGMGGCIAGYRVGVSCKCLTAVSLIEFSFNSWPRIAGRAPQTHWTTILQIWFRFNLEEFSRFAFALQYWGLNQHLPFLAYDLHWAVTPDQFEVQGLRTFRSRVRSLTLHGSPTPNTADCSPVMLGQTFLKQVNSYKRWQEDW